MKIKANGNEIPEIKQKSIIWPVIKKISKNINQEEAFHVCNIDDIIEKHKIWISHFPKVMPYYAVKCNDDVTVLETLAALGTCFDCASKGEISKVLSIGVTPDRIIFANPVKPISHIHYAASMGVSTMTFDNESELYKIRSTYPTASLVIRIRSDARDAHSPLGMKFGCDPIKEAPKLLLVAKTLNLNVVGVSFHVGSGCLEPAAFRRAILAAREVFNYSKLLGFNFSILDIGGGYPGGRGTSISEIATVCNRALNQFFHGWDVRVIAEPGRFYVTSAYTLACNIVSIRNVYGKDEQGNSAETHRIYCINDGIYGSFSGILNDNKIVTATPLKDYSESKKLSSSIWGPTCNGLDQVSEEVLLPKMKLGDWIVFEDMGAYSLSIASTFNGFPVPEVNYVISQKAWSIFRDVLTLPRNKIKVLDVPATFVPDFCSSLIPRSSNDTFLEAKPLTFTGLCSTDLMVG